MGAPPEHLLSYDPPITDAYEWEAGFEEWLNARSRWAERHGIDVDDMPRTHIGDAPFDPSMV